MDKIWSKINSIGARMKAANAKQTKQTITVPSPSSSPVGTSGPTAATIGHRDDDEEAGPRHRRRRRTLDASRSVHRRAYVKGQLEDYRWTPVKDARYRGERLSAGEELPEHITRHIASWEAEHTRMARNHQFYMGRFLQRNPDAPTLFRKFFEYAQDRWGGEAEENYVRYCQRQRNRPEGSAVWNELKTIMRLWDKETNHNRNRMASINKIDFCSLIW